MSLAKSYLDKLIELSVIDLDEEKKEQLELDKNADEFIELIVEELKKVVTKTITQLEDGVEIEDPRKIQLNMEDPNKITLGLNTISLSKLNRRLGKSDLGWKCRKIRRATSSSSKIELFLEPMTPKIVNERN